MLPLAWMAIAGFKGKSEVLRTPFQFFPEVWTVRELQEHPRATREFMRAMTVTFIGAVIFTLCSSFVNSMAAYAFARLEFRGKRLWWVFCIVPLFIPAFAILLTSFVVGHQPGHARLDGRCSSSRASRRPSRCSSSASSTWASRWPSRRRR